MICGVRRRKSHYAVCSAAKWARQPGHTVNLCIEYNPRSSTFLAVEKAEGFDWLETHPTIMMIPHNQQLGHTWLIIAP